MTILRSRDAATSVEIAELRDMLQNPLLANRVSIEELNKNEKRDSEEMLGDAEAP